MPAARFDPYIGVGINYAKIPSARLFAGGAGSLDHDSVGPALQAGID